jgi:tetratricopeptide (TPR) repeat protein
MITRTCFTCSATFSFPQNPPATCPQCHSFYEELFEEVSSTEVTQLLSGPANPAHFASSLSSPLSSSSELFSDPLASPNEPTQFLGKTPAPFFVEGETRKLPSLEEEHDLPSLADMISGPHNPHSQKTLAIQPHERIESFSPSALEALEDHETLAFAQGDDDDRASPRKKVKKPLISSSDSATIITESKLLRQAEEDSEEKVVRTKANTRKNTPNDSPNSVLSPGTRFGKYEIIEKIAQGGMGAVFKVYHPLLQQEFALKVMLAGQGITEDQILRFHLEAKSCSRMRHKHVVAVHDIGQENGIHYLTMDFIQGRDLATFIEKEEYSIKTAVILVKKIAEGLHYAHEQGFLHRDLKPANILLDTQNEPYITDFGLAKRIEQKQTLTQEGAILGTPAYMPPEQALGEIKKIGPPSDIYSLGTILYELLTKIPPFSAGSTLELFHKIMDTDPVAPRRLFPSIPKDIETICLKCLQKEPEQRYLTAKELYLDIERFLEGHPIKARAITPLERTWKFIKRNKVLSLLVLFFSFFLFIALSWGFKEGNYQRKLRHLEALRREAYQTLQEAKDFSRSQKLYQAIFDLDPQYVPAYEEWGTLLAEREQKEAIPFLQKALALEPQRYPLYLVLNQLYKKLHEESKAQEALDSFRQAQGQTEGTPSFFFFKGIQAIQAKQEEEALQYFKQTITLDPSYQDAYLERAELYYKQKKFDQALVEIEEVLKQNPDSLRALLGRIDLFVLQKEEKKAQKELERVLYTLKIQNVPLVWEKLISLQETLERDQAKINLQNALKFCGNAPTLLEIQAVFDYDEQKREESKRNFLLVLKQEPERWKSHLYLSKIYDKELDPENAQSFAQKAYQLNPSEIEVALHYGKLLLFTDHQEGYQLLKKIYSTHPSRFENELKILLLRQAFSLKDQELFEALTEEYLDINDQHFETHIFLGLQNLYQGKSPDSYFNEVLHGNTSGKERLWLSELYLQERLDLFVQRTLEPLRQKNFQHPQLYLLTAKLFYKNGLLEDALEQSFKAYSLAPESPDCLALHGILLCASKNPQGLEVLKKALLCGGFYYEIDLAEGHLTLGATPAALAILQKDFKQAPSAFLLKQAELLSRLEHYEKAQKILQDLQKEKTTPFPALLLSTQIFLKQKDKKSALSALSLAQAYFPKHPLVLQLLNQIQTE